MRRPRHSTMLSGLVGLFQISKPLSYMRWRAFPPAIVSCQCVGNGAPHDNPTRGNDGAQDWLRKSHGVRNPLPDEDAATRGH